MKASRQKRWTLAQWVGLLKKGRKFYHLSDLMKLSGLQYTAVRKAAQRLVQKNILVKLYPEFFGNTFCTYQAEEVANVIYPPSYISCETALFHHGVLDQAPFVIVSVSTRKSKRIKVGHNDLIYRKIDPSLFWGYTRAQGYLLAEPEKALLDWLYFSTKKNAELKLDEINWDQLDRKKLRKYAKQFPMRDVPPFVTIKDHR